MRFGGLLIFVFVLAVSFVALAEENVFIDVKRVDSISVQFLVREGGTIRPLLPGLFFYSSLNGVLKTQYRTPTFYKVRSLPLPNPKNVFGGVAFLGGATLGLACAWDLVYAGSSAFLLVEGVAAMALTGGALSWARVEWEDKRDQANRDVIADAMRFGADQKPVTPQFLEHLSKALECVRSGQLCQRMSNR